MGFGILGTSQWRQKEELFPYSTIMDPSTACRYVSLLPTGADVQLQQDNCGPGSLVSMMVGSTKRWVTGFVKGR